MKPTVGRIVLFHPIAEITQAAVIAFVHSDTMVNLAVFDGNGVTSGKTSVQLISEGQAKPEFGQFCEWVPHHFAQATQPVQTVALKMEISKETTDAIERLIQRLDQELALPT